MIRWQNSNNDHDTNIQSYFVSGQGADIIVGSNAYVNTGGAWARWTSSTGGSAIRYGRAGELIF